jgi:TolB-like protein/DNA-binding winged helix-turn-helix (wHTH) protein/tetratricopeptide (TPR) repeat protein
MDTASPSKSERVRFGVFELDLRSRELRRQGVRVKLQEQPFQLLEVLLERPGDVVTREELRQRIWSSDTFVDFEGGLYNAVKKLREALSDTADTPRFIETLPRRGYRFIAPVNGTNDAPKAGVPTKADGENASTASRLRLRLGLSVGLGSAALLVALLGLIPGDVWRRLPFGSRTPRIRSIAVLPLKNLSDDPSQNYFAYGMAEELITNLSQVRALKVVSHTSVLRYENSGKSVPQIARELGVDAVIEGAVQRSADRVRITTQLIYAPQDTNLWARTYDRDLRDVLGLQSTMAKEIADEIRVNMSSGETARLTKPRTVDPGALQAYWKGQYYLSSLRANSYAKDKPKANQEEEFRQAVAYFEEAIRRDPNYAPAYLGYWDSLFFFQDDVAPSPSPATVLAKGRTALTKALALDDTLPNAHLALANAFFYLDWNWQGAEREYRRVLELNSNSAEGHCHYAEFLNSMGRFEEGLKEQEIQLDLNPDLDCEVFSPLLPLEAHIERARRYIETHRARNEHYWDLGLLLWKASRYKEATDVWQEWMTRLGYAEVAQAVGRGYARDGYPGALRQWAKAGEAAAKQRNVSCIMMVYVYGVLGDNDRAFAWLEKAYARRESSLQSLKVFIAWDPIRSDPRFAEMVRRVGLPP